MINSFKEGTYSYLSMVIKHVNLTIYMLAFLYVHHKVYLPELPLEEIFNSCPPTEWEEMTENSKTEMIANYNTFLNDIKAFRVLMSLVFFA